MLSKKRSITELLDIIDEVHRIAHSGALDNVNPEVIDNIADMFKELLDVKLNPKQAQKVFDVSPARYRNTISRKVPESEKNRVRENTSFIRYSLLKKLFK